MGKPVTDFLRFSTTDIQDLCGNPNDAYYFPFYFIMRRVA